MGEPVPFPLLKRKRTLQVCSLREVLAKIVHGDVEALNELITYRPVFEGTCFAAFIHQLRQRNRPFWKDSRIVDAAADSVTDKFGTLRDDDSPDCRRYYQLALDTVSQDVAALETELQLTHVLTRYVRRHFRYGLQEAARNGEWSRYEWQLESGTLPVLLPRGLSGDQRRRWLDTYVGSADASLPGEKERVQSIINDHLGETPVYDEGQVQHSVLGQTLPSPRDGLERLTSEQLRSAIALEKSECIDQQRPAIQKLGPGRLHSLVLAIFEALEEGSYTEQSIAESFDLDKATFSRFAGTHWRSKEKATVPDLWRNFAHMLAREPQFAETCERAGVWKRVADIDVSSQQKGRSS